MDKKPLERWHGAHHYSDKVHILFLFFLFLGIGVLIWSYFVLSDSRFAYRNNPSPTIAPTPTVGQTTPVPSAEPTCRPRPACLDAIPRCLIPETSDMCPPSITPSSNSKKSGKVCTQDAKLCPDGSYVSRTGPNCEFICPE